MIFRSVAVFLSLWLVSCTAVGATDRAAGHFPTPSRSIQGTHYPSACTPKQRRELRQVVAKSQPPDEQAAWTLIETALCAPADAVTLAYLDAHVPRRIEQVEADLDAETKNMVKKDRNLLTTIATAGEAWDASLDVSRDGMTLQYYWNEACIRWLAFEYTKGKWMLRQLRSACD